MFSQALETLSQGYKARRAQIARRLERRDPSLRKVAFGAVVLGGLLLSSACAPLHSSMLRGAVAPPPLSFERTCTDAPGECELPRLDYVATLSDPQALRLLQHVNSAVNARMAGLATEQINARDEWLPARATPSGLAGDCKSFAAEKRRMLIAEGFPADQLSYAVVFRGDLGLHALLMARLNGGDYVLDSRQPWVTPWSEAGYTFVLYQEPGSPGEWRTALGAGGVPVAMGGG